MKTISICNQKGGVGKTTTAINLSAYLSQKGYKILLIDLDPQANATSGVGIKAEQQDPSTYDILLEQIDIQQAIKPTKINNLSIIPSNTRLAGASVELINALAREYKLKNAINAIRHDYDYIFIDCPPSLGVLTINALAASDSTLITLQCEYYAIEGLSQLLNTIELAKRNLNQALTIEGVLLTMADYRTKLTTEVIEEARRFLKEKVYNTIIPRSIKLSESPGYGEPIMLYDKHSQGAQAYQQLSNEFIIHNPSINKELQQKINHTENTQQQNTEDAHAQQSENINTIKECADTQNSQQ